MSCYIGIGFYIIGVITFLTVAFQYLLKFILRLWNPSCCLTNRFGKWAVVTGATDGIGEAMALDLSQNGMNLVLISRSQEKLELTKNKIARESPNCQIDVVAFDFSHQKWQTEILNKLKSKLDDLDVGILVNNVGMAYPSALRFEELSEDMLNDLISVNIRSVFHLTRMVLPGMRKRRRGSIICIGSGASVVPTEPLYAGYVSVKSAVEAFCKSLQVECVSDNILVQCQTPLLITTKLSKIKTPSVTVITPKAYSSSALDTIRTSFPSYWSSSTACPNMVHSLILKVSNILPLGIWNRIRLAATSAIRERHLKKHKIE